MEKLNQKKQSLLYALTTLADGLAILQEQKSIEWQRLMENGVIQRFEYCIDGFLKFIKLFLEKKQSTVIAFNSPNAIVLEAKNIGIINEKEAIILLQCIADRNLTSHTYREQLTFEIASHLELYYKTMKTIVDRLD